MNKTSRYFISLCFSVVILWYGIHGIKAAEYMISLLVWLGVLIGILALGKGNEKLRNAIAKDGRPVPAWISTSITIVFIIILLYYGWIWTAFGYLIRLNVSYDLYKPLKTCQKED